MMDVKALQKERTSIYEDLYSNKIPKRVPVDVGLSLEWIAEFGGADLVEAQWNPSLIEEAADKLCRTIYSDNCPFLGAVRYPAFYQILESQSFIMGSNGFIQHPEVVGMLAEDYDYLIERPLDCLFERVIPRQYKALGLDNPVKMALSLAKSYQAANNDFMLAGMLNSTLVERYGYYGAPPTANGFTEAPFDFLADQLRGFKEISMDVRRRPEQVAEACEALYPIVFQKGMPAVPTEYSYVGIPLHMPTYMREKDFAKLWWPSFKRMLDEYASLGIHASIFCEDDWTRYLDYLYELPTNTVMWFEYGDPKLIKEKLGKKHIIKGLYPLTILKNSTKQQCLDKAQELIDVLAPGGKYIFSTDKVPLAFRDVNLENFCALTEFVRDYGLYSNAGDKAGLEFKKEDYGVDCSAPRKLASKYYIRWEQLKAQYPLMPDFGIQKLQGIEDGLFQYLVHLLL